MITAFSEGFESPFTPDGECLENILFRSLAYFDLSFSKNDVISVIGVKNLTVLRHLSKLEISVDFNVSLLSLFNPFNLLSFLRIRSLYESRTQIIDQFCDSDKSVLVCHAAYNDIYGLDGHWHHYFCFFKNSDKIHCYDGLLPILRQEEKKKISEVAFDDAIRFSPTIFMLRK